MRNSHDLHRLICSLTQAEKRYFKLFASLQGKRKNYMRLFDAIGGQSTYSEDALRKKFSGEKFMRQFNVAKKYLYNQIMRSLRVFHAGDGAYPDLEEQLAMAKILYKKGLNDQAAKALRKVIEGATACEDFVVLLSAISAQETIDQETQWTLESLAARRARKLELLERIRNAEEYGVLVDTIGITIQHGRPRTVNELELLKCTMSHPLLRSETMALSNKARLFYHLAWAANHYALGRYAEALRSIDHHLGLLHEQPALIFWNPINYVTLLHDRLVLCSLLDDSEEFERSIDRLKASAIMLLESRMVKGTPLRSRIFTTLYHNMLNRLVNTGQFERCLELAQEVESGLQRYDRHIVADDRRMMQFLLARAHFAHGNHARAMELNNRLLADRTAPHNNGVLHAAHIFDLILHYEMGNIDLVDYHIRSVRRYLRLSPGPRRVERAVVDTLYRLVRAGSRDAERAALEQMRSTLTELENDPLEQDAFTYFDYHAWIESRISGTTLADLGLYRRAQRQLDRAA